MRGLKYEIQNVILVSTNRNYYMVKLTLFLSIHLELLYLSLYLILLEFNELSKNLSGIS